MPKKETIKKITKYIEIKVFLKNASIIEKKKNLLIGGSIAKTTNESAQTPAGLRGLRGMFQGLIQEFLLGAGAWIFFQRHGVWGP